MANAASRQVELPQFRRFHSDVGLFCTLAKGFQQNRAIIGM